MFKLTLISHPKRTHPSTFIPALKKEPPLKPIMWDGNLVIKEKKRRAMKCKSVAITNEAENNDLLHQDRVAIEPSPHKSVGSSGRKRQRYNVVVEAAPSELPQEFKDKIDELGTRWLSIPSKQIKNVHFLREGEIEDLEGRNGIDVKLILPSFEITNLTFAKWNMHKKNGSISSRYVLRSSSWKKLNKDNNLKVRDRVQVLSFRI